MVEGQDTELCVQLGSATLDRDLVLEIVTFPESATTGKYEWIIFHIP